MRSAEWENLIVKSERERKRMCLLTLSIDIVYNQVMCTVYEWVVCILGYVLSTSTCNVVCSSCPAATVVINLCVIDLMSWAAIVKQLCQYILSYHEVPKHDDPLYSVSFLCTTSCLICSTRWETSNWILPYSSLERSIRVWSLNLICFRLHLYFPPLFYFGVLKIIV